MTGLLFLCLLHTSAHSRTERALFFSLHLFADWRSQVSQCMNQDVPQGFVNTPHAFMTWLGRASAPMNSILLIPAEYGIIPIETFRYCNAVEVMTLNECVPVTGSS